MDQREKKWLGREAAELVEKLPDKDARRMRRALATTDGARQFTEFLRVLYQLPAEQRVKLLVRLEQINQFRAARG